MNTSSLYTIRQNLAENNNYFYFFHNYSLQELKKHLSFPQSSIYGTTHTKKIATSIQNHFLEQLSVYAKPYFHYYFVPTNNLEELNKREEVITSILIQNIEEEEVSLLSYLSQLKPLQYSQKPHLQIYTCEEEISEYLYEHYLVSSVVLSQEEVEQFGEEQPEAIYVGNSYVLSFAYEYKLEEFEALIRGFVYEGEKERVKQVLEILKDFYSYLKQYEKAYALLKEKDFQIKQIGEEMYYHLQQSGSLYSNVKTFVDELRHEVESLNSSISKDLKDQTISLSGDEVIALLENKTSEALQEKLLAKYEDDISRIKEFIKTKLSQLRLTPRLLLTKGSYPLELDEEEISELFEEAASKGEEDKRVYLKELGGFMSFDFCDQLFDFLYFVEMLLMFKKEFSKKNYQFSSHGDELLVNNLEHFFITNPTPVSYSLGSDQCRGVTLNSERVSLITGANSGGKTTLVESIMQATLLTSMGFPIKGDFSSSIPRFNKITYLKKFTGTQGAGAFEQTLKQLLDLLEDKEKNQLIVIDELEAVTEPGAAANILLSFLKELAKQNKYAIAISHLGEELENLISNEKITSIRIDGISAEGLDEKGKLITNHQPHFYSRGKSTPELIMKRVLMDEKFWKDKSEETKEVFEKLLD